MNILDYFNEENKKKLGPINDAKTKSPLMQLRIDIKMLHDTLQIKKDDQDKLLWIIDKAFPITLWSIFSSIMLRLKDISVCNNKDNCLHDHDRQRITEESFDTLITLLHSVYGDKFSLKTNLNTCAALISEKIIFEYDDINFTECQKRAIFKMLNFLEDSKANVFGLYGYAGTGKTTLITKFVREIVAKKYIHSINFSAPTNKAVNVIKNNFAECVEGLLSLFTASAGSLDTFNKQTDFLKSHGVNINLTTIHKLLEYKNELNKKGEKVFVRKDKSSNKILTSYDLIIIDECSMLELQIIVDLFKTINKLKNGVGGSVGLVKIIFIGDPAQLAPVNESTSCVFNTKKTEFKEYVLNQYFNESEKNTYYVNNFIDSLLSFDKIVLDEIVRSSSANVKGLCNECRQWVLGTIKLPRLRQYKCDNVKIYKYAVGTKKTDSNWFKKYVNYVKRNDAPVNNIILTWRNAPTDEYNTAIRKMLFKKEQINQYEPGDVLMMNEFYALQPLIKTEKIDKHDKKSKLYTCEQIKVIGATVVSYKLKRLTVPKIPPEYEKLIGEKIKKIVTDFNIRIPKEYQVWRLIVKKLADNAIFKSGIDDLSEYDYLMNSKYAILTHKEEMLERINNDKAYIKKQMELLGVYLENKFPDKKKLEMLTEKIIIDLWRQLNEIMEDPYANVNICFSMTTHKSQSSTYYNVFVDVDDLLTNANSEDARKCLYTVTRTSHELHLLI
jgi:hypothetical protein